MGGSADWWGVEVGWWWGLRWAGLPAGGGLR